MNEPNISKIVTKLQLFSYYKKYAEVLDKKIIKLGFTYLNKTKSIFATISLVVFIYILLTTDVSYDHVVGIIVNIVLIGAVFFSDSQQLKDIKSLKIKEYLLSGIFSISEVKNIEKNIVTFYLKKSTVFILCIGILNIIITIKQNKYYDLAILFFLMSTGIYTVKDKLLYNFNNKNSNKHWQNKFAISVMVSIFIILVYHFSNVAQNFVKQESLWIIAKYLNLIVLFIQFVILINKKFIINHKIKKKYLQTNFKNPTIRDFFYREVKSRIHVIPYLLIIFMIVPISSLSFTFTVISILMFFYTPFNNRFWLNEKTLNYINVVGNRGKNFFNFNFFVFYIPTAIIFFIFQILRSLTLNYSIIDFIIGQLILFLIFSINNVIYANFSGLQGSHETILKRIELFSGLPNAIMLILGIYMGVSL